MGLFDIFGTGDQQAAANSQISGINAGLNGPNGINPSFQSGRDALQTNYSLGLQPFQTNFSTATQGTNALGNALGLNGPAGNAAAVAAFQNNPGYEFAKQQGINAIDANQERMGQGASGNTNLDIGQWVTNNANQNWNNYVSQLQPFLGASNAAATGIGSLYSNLGNQQNANFIGQGNANYGGQASIGNANANANLAGLNASANQLGALSGLGGALFGFV